MSDVKQALSEIGGTTRSIADDSWTGQLVSKWSPLLTGVKNPYQRKVVAMLMENQSTHFKTMNEDTLSTGVGQFTKYVFPLLRRVYPKLNAFNFCSVQPLSAPVGGIAHYELKYQDEKGNGTTGTAGKNAVQVLAKHYSSEFIDYAVLIAAADVDGTKKVWDGSTNSAERQSIAWLPVHVKDAAKGYVMTVYATVGGALKTFTENGLGKLLDSSGVERGTIVYATGVYTLNLATAPDAGTPVYASYFYDSEKVSSTTGAKTPSMYLDVTITEIKARSHKLKVRWSAEAADDLKNLHGTDAEAELVSGMGNEVSAEIDSIIIDEIMAGASHSASWTFGPAFGGSNLHGMIDSIRSLITTIDSVSARIHKTSKRGQANFIVVSPIISSLLAQLQSHGDYTGAAPETIAASSIGGDSVSFGVYRAGTIQNKYVVYVNPYMDETQILVGRVGNTYIDAGYVYAPYIAVQMTDTFQDPDDFTMRKGIRTRFATKMVRPEFYGVITVSGLPTVSSV